VGRFHAGTGRWLRLAVAWTCGISGSTSASFQAITPRAGEDMVGNSLQKIHGPLHDHDFHPVIILELDVHRTDHLLQGPAPRFPLASFTGFIQRRHLPG
jgi:hypothetical protein